MRRTVLALIAVAALLTLTSPAMAQNSMLCSVLNGVSQAIGGGPVDGVIANNCPAPPSNAVGTSTSSPTVATPEPLAMLVVGLGLLGTRLLRRR